MKCFHASKRDLRRTQAGFTLVELMVAMVVSTVLIFFLFSIQTKMSIAFRGQSTVSEIIENQESAKQMLVRELQMAGYKLGGNGGIAVSTAVNASNVLPGLSIFNDVYNDGADSFRILYAEAEESTIVTSLDTVLATSSTGSFPVMQLGQKIVLASRNNSCLLAVTQSTPSQIGFTPLGVGLPYNMPGAGGNLENSHCDAVLLDHTGTLPVVISRLVASSYRIDPNRPALGVLQHSPSGEFTPADWIDMGFGFTNLQMATRYFEVGDLVDQDGDGDPQRDWYSSDNQSVPDLSPTPRPANARAIQVNLSIEGRSPFGTKGAAASDRTPAFTDISKPLAHNSIGDWVLNDDCAFPNGVVGPCGIDLKNTPDAQRPERYRGEHIYRSTSSRVDLRNIGVGL